MNFNLNLIRDELTSDEEEEDDNTLEEEKKIDDSNESRKKTTTISVDVPVLEEEEWNDEEIEQYKSQSRLQRISLTRRRIISAFQWSSKILWYVLAIMALIDIGIAPNENKYYLYLNQASATAAGYPFHGSIYGAWPYFVIQTVAFGLMCAGFFVEWRSYSVRMMGVDVKFDVIPIFLLDDQYVIDSIMQAKYSLTPFGAAYDNYVYFLLFQAMMFFLVFFHIFIEGWDMMFFCVLYVIFGFWSFIIDVFYMVKLYFYANREYQRYLALKDRYEELKKSEIEKRNQIIKAAIRRYKAQKRKEGKLAPSSKPSKV